MLAVEAAIPSFATQAILPTKSDRTASSTSVAPRYQRHGGANEIRSQTSKMMGTSASRRINHLVGQCQIQ